MLLIFHLLIILSLNHNTSLILSYNIVDVVYSTWKQVLDPCDLKWISKALFRVNQQGKPEMCFDVIDHMWYHPPSPPLVCTQPPIADRCFDSLML